MNTACTVYRCSRQAEMYLYLREGLDPATLPEPLRQRAGTLTPVMQLNLHPQRRLARVQTARVIEQLQSQGWFLQMPPNGQVEAHLHFGD